MARKRNSGQVAGNGGAGVPMAAPSSSPVSYVTAIRGNVGGAVDARLGRHTLIVGPNMSGKSMIIRALELALTASVSDLVGRATVAREADLIALAPSGPPPRTLWAEALLSSGGAARCEIVSDSHGKAHRGVRTGMDGLDFEAVRVFPLRAVREALLGSPDTARKFFVRYALGDVGAGDVLSRIPEPVRARFMSLTSSAPDVLGGLLLATEQSAGKKREAEARRRTAEEIVAQGSAGLPARPMVGDFAAMEASVQGSRLAVEALIRREVAVTVTAGRRAPGVSPIESAFFALAEEQKASTGIDHCLLCGTPRMTNAILSRLGALRAEMQRRQPVAPVFAPSPEKQRELEAARLQLAVGEGQLASMRNTESQWATLEGARSVGVQAEREAAEWATVAKACRTAVADLLDVGVAAFSRKVQAFLPPTLKFQLRLREGSREVFQFGLERNGAIHMALSGAEWAMVTAAMAAAVGATGTASPGSLSILVLEDRGFDPGTLVTVLRALSTYPGQVLIATPTVPSEKVAGWDVITTGANPRGSEAVGQHAALA